MSKKQNEKIPSAKKVESDGKSEKVISEKRNSEKELKISGQSGTASSQNTAQTTSNESTAQTTSNESTVQATSSQTVAQTASSQSSSTSQDDKDPKEQLSKQVIKELEQINKRVERDTKKEEKDAAKKQKETEKKEARERKEQAKKQKEQEKLLIKNQKLQEKLERKSRKAQDRADKASQKAKQKEQRALERNRAEEGEPISKDLASQIADSTQELKELANEKIAEISNLSKNAIVQQKTAAQNEISFLNSFGKNKDKILEEIRNQKCATVKPTDTLYTLLEDRVRRMPNKKFVQFKVKNNMWASLTASQFKDEVDKITKGLIAIGVKKGDSVSIMAHTSYDWVAVDFALLSIGAVCVPIYETSSSEQIKYITNEVGTKYIFLENEEYYERLAAVETEIKSLKEIFLFNKGALDYLKMLGEDVTNKQLAIAHTQVVADDIALIVFTSGSTGTPKGVMLKHGPFSTVAKNVNVTLSELVYSNKKHFLLFLPLSHVFAHFLVFAIMSGNAWVALSGDIKNLLSDLAIIKPTSLLAVPRIFEKVYNAASHKAGKGVKSLIFKRSVMSAVKYAKMQETGMKPGDIVNLVEHAVYKQLVYKNINNAIGGNVKYCVSGGAPLNKQTNLFFRGAGITILEGYGLTETGAPVMVNRPKANKVGTIGLPFPGTELKIADDGELLIKTKSLFSGYYKNPKATEEAIDKDGWFHSGDLAKIDEDGFVSITGRKKNLIITAGGKNVAPEKLEQIIEKNSLVDNAVVVGDRKPFIAALITLDAEEVKRFMQKHGRAGKMTLEKACKDPAILNEVNRSVMSANKTVSRAESVRKFVILPEQFNMKDGTLTTSAKVCRPAVIERYKEVMEKDIYNKK